MTFPVHADAAVVAANRIYGIAAINMTVAIPSGLFPQKLAGLRVYSVLATRKTCIIYMLVKPSLGECIASISPTGNE